MGATLTTDRKSTRLNSSHVKISYAVFCLKKKTKRLRQEQIQHRTRTTGRTSPPTSAVVHVQLVRRILDVDGIVVAHRDHPVFFFFNDTATTEIYTLSLHDALPI